MVLINKCVCLGLVFSLLESSESFVTGPGKAFRQSSNIKFGTSHLAAPTTSSASEELKKEKEKLLGLVRAQPVEDPVLADPITKGGVTFYSKSTLLGGSSGASRVKYEIKSANNTFTGSSDTFYNLLEPVKPRTSSTSSNLENENTIEKLVEAAVPFIPPQFRSVLAVAGLPVGDNYIPMRDLFTSPSVSFAYERGWRQGFAGAGFPGPDREAEMAMEYFEPAMAESDSKVLVDMSCATGLFTRRFALSGKYKRVLGCDYSESMLEEARRRIRSNRELRKNTKTQLDLVRLDVGQIPMKNESIDALHAGAAMHCWPDLPGAVSEIHRVLKPGGRYFATTFLSQYFSTLQSIDGGANSPSTQAFQYFVSVDQLRSLIEGAGFEHDKILIEVLGSACVVIRAEK